MKGAVTGTGGVLATSSPSVSRLPAFFSSISSKPSLFFTEHYLHWPSASASHQVAHSQLLKSSSVSDGSRKSRLLKTSCAKDERSSHEDERRMPRGSSSGRWSNQKRLLALFKNIETSISQEKARSVNQRDSKSSRDDNDSFDSVLDALQQSGRPWNVQTLNKEGDRTSIHKNRAAETKKEPSLPDLQPPAFKVIRPPSNFTRKSPIPSPSTPRISSIEQNAVVESRDGEAVEDKEPLELEKKKLTELKEIAKARGIKGYSKLKKSELLDLLSTQAEP